MENQEHLSPSPLPPSPFANSPSEYVTFRIKGQLYGIPVVLVREINRHLDITPVQNSLPFVSGLANLRGQIITVLDTAIRLGLEPIAISETSHCIVLKTSSELLASRAVREFPELLDHAGPDLVALLVETIDEVVRSDETDLESAPANISEADHRFLQGVCKLEDELLLVLDLKTLLEPE